MEDARDWEAVGDAMLERTGLAGASEDMLELARAYGLILWPTRREGASVRRGRIVFDERATLAQRNRDVAMALARWALAACGLRSDDIAAHVAARTLLRRAMPRSLAQAGN